MTEPHSLNATSLEDNYMKMTRALMTVTAVSCSVLMLACGVRQKPVTGKYVDLLGLKSGDMCQIETLNKKYAPLCRDESTLLKLSDAQFAGREGDVRELLKAGDVSAILATDRLKCVEVKERTIEVMVFEGEHFGRTGVVWIGMLKRAKADAKTPVPNEPDLPADSAHDEKPKPKPQEKPSEPVALDLKPESKPETKPDVTGNAGPKPPAPVEATRPAEPKPTREPPKETPKPVVVTIRAKVTAPVFLGTSKLALSQVDNAELKAKWVKEGTLLVLTDSTEVEIVSREKDFATVKLAGKKWVVEAKHVPEK